MQTVILTVESLSPQRADAAVASLLENISRAAAIRLIESGNITVNGKKIKKSDKVAKGDVLTVVLPDPEPERALPEDIPLDIVYEDDDLLVVNKPKGMVVHPAAGNKEHTLVNALLFHCKDSLSGIGGVKRPGIVHRIDKDTSGLLIVAKNDFAHVGLASQIKDHSFTREYKAVVIGCIKDSEGIVDAPIGRHPVKRKCMAVTDKNSKNAVTHYFVERHFPGYTFVRLRLKTGRTHQIRVHMAYIGHPVAGDPLYGGLNKDTEVLSGQCLHAGLIGFIHPRTGKYMEFEAPLPDYFKEFLKKHEL